MATASPSLKSPDLKRFLDAKKKPTRILGDLERHLQARPKEDRSTTVLHPSEIIKRDWCKRASYFLLLGYPKVAANPVLRMQNIFDEGHFIHAKWQRWLQEMGKLHGEFRCGRCDGVTFGTAPQACEHCGASWKHLRYDEVTLLDPDLRIAGHTDGWIKDLGDDALIEIKSIGPGTLRSEAPQLMKDADGDFMKAWSNVRRPFGPHILQGQMYLELMERMGHHASNGKPINEIVFLYELKADQSYKEFVIRKDYELVRHVFDGALKVIVALEAGTPPPCSNNLGGNCPQCSPYKEETE